MCCPHKAHSQGSLCFSRPKAIGRKQWHWECPSPPYKVSYAQGGWTLWWMRFCCSHSLILLVFSSPELYPSAFQPRGLLFTPLYLPHPLCFTSPAIPQCLTPSFLLPKFLVLSCVYLIKHHHVTFWITWPDHVCSYGQLPPQTAVPVFCSLNFENIVYLYIQKRPNLGKFSDNYLVDSLGTRRAFKTVILYCQNSDTLSWYFWGFYIVSIEIQFCSPYRHVGLEICSLGCIGEKHMECCISYAQHILKNYCFLESCFFSSVYRKKKEFMDNVLNGRDYK